MSHVTCPFCFKVHDFKSSRICPETDLEVPEAYVDDYSTTPPLWLMTAGFKAAGKTSYVGSLTLLFEEIERRFGGHFLALDRHSFKTLRTIRDRRNQGEDAEPTQLSRVRPLLLQAHGLPGIDSRCLVIYDMPGEIFDDFDSLSRLAPALRKVSTAWLFVSIKDLKTQGEGRTLKELFQVYLSGLRRLKVRLENWNLIVIYTKADQEKLTPSIKRYVATDPIYGEAPDWWQQDDADSPFDSEQYGKDLEDRSRELEAFTRSIDGGSGFISMARTAGMRLEFSVTSALGAGPERRGGTLREIARPHRVIDPYLWAAQLQKPVETRQIYLAVDAGWNTSPGGASLKVVELWGRLAGFGEVWTFVLGRTRSTAGPGQAPPSSSDRHPASLIGPLLGRLKANDVLIVLAAGPILDLKDFQVERPRGVFLVTSEGVSTESWPPCATSRPGLALDNLVEQALKS